MSMYYITTYNAYVYYIYIYMYIYIYAMTLSTIISHYIAAKAAGDELSLITCNIKFHHFNTIR